MFKNLTLDQIKNQLDAKMGMKKWWWKRWGAETATWVVGGIGVALVILGYLMMMASAGVFIPLTALVSGFFGIGLGATLAIGISIFVLGVLLASIIPLRMPKLIAPAQDWFNKRAQAIFELGQTKETLFKKSPSPYYKDTTINTILDKIDDFLKEKELLPEQKFGLLKLGFDECSEKLENLQSARSEMLNKMHGFVTVDEDLFLTLGSHKMLIICEKQIEILKKMDALISEEKEPLSEYLQTICQELPKKIDELKSTVIVNKQNLEEKVKDETIFDMVGPFIFSTFITGENEKIKSLTDLHDKFEQRKIAIEIRQNVKNIATIVEGLETSKEEDKPSKKKEIKALFENIITSRDKLKDDAKVKIYTGEESILAEEEKLKNKCTNFLDENISTKEKAFLSWMKEKQPEIAPKQN